MIDGRMKAAHQRNQRAKIKYKYKEKEFRWFLTFLTHPSLTTHTTNTVSIEVVLKGKENDDPLQLTLLFVENGLRDDTNRLYFLVTPYDKNQILFDRLLKRQKSTEPVK